VVAGREPSADLWRPLRGTDAVYGMYYLFLHPVTALGTGEIVTRLPSVLAAAATAGGIAVLGRRFFSPTAGLSAGLIYAVLPIVSWYAQEARQYAIVSAGAVLATYLLTRALERPAPPSRLVRRVRRHVGRARLAASLRIVPPRWACRDHGRDRGAPRISMGIRMA
jgi:membrane protein implicated in regulation of membrane protease activity